MTTGHLIYADSDEVANRIIAGLPEGNPIALFSRATLAPTSRVIFFRVRDERNPNADLAAARAAFPGIRWEAPTIPDAPVRSPFPPVSTARLRDRRPLRIEAVAVTCGGKRSAREALLMIETMQHFHPELPIYALTGATGAEVLRSVEWMRDGDQLEELSPDDLDELQSAARDAARPHGDAWPIYWIAAKIECLLRAIRAFPGQGVLLADADLIFTRRLAQFSWEADLVLSEHSGPIPDRLPPRSGIYNAGMVLARDAGVVERWRDLFYQGVGGFYEQGCLEQLAREFVADVFPASWNWGNWRRSEDIEASGRTPPILHHHLDRVREIPHREEATRGLDAIARRSLAEIRAAKARPGKIAILHHAKAAGSSLSAMLEEAALRGGWQYLDTYRAPLRWRRDWTPAELDGIASGQMMGLHGQRRIVHNHACGWPAETVERWTQEGWVFISVYRPIRDRLCSFYHWNRRARILTGPAADCEDLDLFINHFLNDPRYLVDFAPHPCDAHVRHWATPETLAAVVEEVTGIPVAVRRENVSENRGWKEADEKEELLGSTKRRVAQHPAVKAWERFAKQRGFEP